MRIVCVSDTHERHRGIRVPDGDLLIHAGDITLRGDSTAIAEGFDWLSGLPHERIVFVPGNHDFAFAERPDIVPALAARYPRVTILIDQSLIVDDVRLYGSPYQPWFHDWAFNFARGEDGIGEARERWKMIPGDTQLLITHGPVRGILDRVSNGTHAGCPELRERIAALPRLALHVCGHIHEAYGAEQGGGVLYVNAACCDLSYRPTQPPIVVDFDDAGARLVELTF